MRYRVVLLPRAKQQLFDQAKWWAENRSMVQAFRWLEGFEKALASLAVKPERFSLARENEAFKSVIRELHYGVGSKPTHRAVFEMRGG